MRGRVSAAASRARQHMDGVAETSGAGFWGRGLRSGQPWPVKLHDFGLPVLSFAFDHGVAPVGGLGGRCWLLAVAMRRCWRLGAACRARACVVCAQLVPGRRGWPVKAAGLVLGGGSRAARPLLASLRVGAWVTGALPDGVVNLPVRPGRSRATALRYGLSPAGLPGLGDLVRRASRAASSRLPALRLAGRLASLGRRRGSF